MTRFIDGMARARHCRCRVFHFDCFWMREFNWCDFEWDRDASSPTRRACCSGSATGACASASGSTRTSPSARRCSPRARRRLSAAPAGRRRVAVGPVAAPAWRWSTSPTRPPATGTRRSCEALLDAGRRLLQDRLRRADPARRRLADGSDPERMHNYYTLPLQPDRLRRAAQAPRRGRGGASSPARRPPAASSSRCTGAATASPRTSRWPSRCAAGCRSGCPASASGATTSAASRAPRTPALFKRWIAFGLLSSHSRLHGSSLVPRAVAVRRGGRGRAAAVHPAEARLMPYLYAAAAQGARARACR